jgi:hypothetical protein
MSIYDSIQLDEPSVTPNDGTDDTAVQTEVSGAAAPDTEDIDPKELAKISRALEKMGIDPAALTRSITATSEMVKQQSLSTLKQQWGEQFDTNWTTVQERYKALPAESKATLHAIYTSDVDIAQKLLEFAPVSSVPGSSVPSFDKSSNTGNAGSQYLFTNSQLRKLSPAQYRDMEPQITAAYAAGKVDVNS